MGILILGKEGPVVGFTQTSMCLRELEERSVGSDGVWLLGGGGTRISGHGDFNTVESTNLMTK